MRAKIAGFILISIIAIFSWLFWMEADKIGDVFLSGGDVVVKLTDKPVNAGRINDIKDISEEREPAQAVEPEIKNETSTQEVSVVDENVPDILPPAPKIVSAPVLDLPELMPAQAAGDGALTRAGIIGQTNKQRQTNLGSGDDLKENVYLDIAAVNKIKDMFDNQYFEHKSPLGFDVKHFVGLAGYEYIVIGENLAKGDYESDADVVQAWMDSPGHRENILKSGYEEIGAAAGYGMFAGQKTWLAVQIFAAPESACPKVSADLSVQIEAAKIALDKSSAVQELLLTKINQEKETALALQNELNNLIVSRAASAIKAKQIEASQAAAAVNQDAGEYNAAIKNLKTFYDSYKQKINLYNSQVTAYNSCLAALE